MTKTWIALLGLLAILVMATPAMAQDNTPAAAEAAKGITLQDWNDSSLNEKYSFLLGMATMVEMEKYWRAKHNDTLVDKWAVGFADPTFKQIVEKVDAYAQANPDKMNQYLLQVLWYQIVAPKIAAGQ